MVGVFFDIISGWLSGWFSTALWLVENHVDRQAMENSPLGQAPTTISVAFARVPGMVRGWPSKDKLVYKASK